MVFQRSGDPPRSRLGRSVEGQPGGQRWDRPVQPAPAQWVGALNGRPEAEVSEVGEHPHSQDPGGEGPGAGHQITGPESRGGRHRGHYADLVPGPAGQSCWGHPRGLPSAALPKSRI